MTYLYHLCTHDFRGTTLSPLNGLRTQFPDVYAREKRKWAGRESVLEYVVPGLGVAWADTVNLSALDPRLLLAERQKLGVPFSRLLERRLVRIPLERIATLRAVHYVSRSHWLNSSPGEQGIPQTPPDSEFSPFDAAQYQEVCEVPRLHSEYLLRQKARGELALGFVFIPHVLVGGAIDISGLERVQL